METGRTIRALNLLSGGLDSRLAACVLKEQGIEVQGVCFESPFFGAAAARAAAAQLRITLHVVDFTRDILALLDAPPHGFGACLNPCIDCHARMLRRAGEMMAAMGFHFLSTGEVLNERPMSQTRRSLEIVARESGCAELVLRPLSARLLPETRPEREGSVDRSRLLGLQGRSRGEQMKLAAHYGLHEYPSPAGGCLLTEPNFCRRLADLKRHEGLADLRAVHLLRVGRHIRLADRVKLVVGRNAQDNAFLEGSAEPGELVLKPENIPGPTAIMPGTAGEEQVRAAAGVCARYSDAPAGKSAGVLIRSSQGTRRLEVMPADSQAVDRLKI